MTGEEQPTAGRRQEEPVMVEEAARRLHRSVDAIRSALRRGKLQGFKGNDGEWRIYLPAGGRQGDIAPSAAAVLQQELDRIRAELQQAKDSAEAWRRQAEDSRVAAAELRTRAELLQQMVEREQHRAEELAAELRELRRPWWRRLMETRRPA